MERPWQPPKNFNQPHEIQPHIEPFHRRTRVPCDGNVPCRMFIRDGPQSGPSRLEHSVSGGNHRVGQPTRPRTARSTIDHLPALLASIKPQGFFASPPISSNHFLYPGSIPTPSTIPTLESQRHPPLYIGQAETTRQPPNHRTPPIKQGAGPPTPASRIEIPQPFEGRNPGRNGPSLPGL